MMGVAVRCRLPVAQPPGLTPRPETQCNFCRMPAVEDECA
jgi:hypothetical protein